MSKIDNIKNSLLNLNNISVINVTRDYFLFISQNEIKNKVFIPYEIIWNIAIEPSCLDKIFDKLKEIVQKLNENLIIIVFQENFFSKGVELEESTVDKIFNLCSQFTSNYEKVLLFINLMKKSPNYPQANLSEKIDIYTNKIYSSKISKSFWNVNNRKIIINEAYMIENCSFCYMIGKILFSHKKSSYSFELVKASNYNIGFFEKNEIGNNLNPKELELANLIINNIGLHICFDLNIEGLLNDLKNEKKKLFLFDESNNKKINDLISLYDSEIDVEKKCNKKKFI